MSYALWQPGMAVQAPVYLDANVVVAYLVNSQPLYKRSATLMGELLAAQAPMLFSVLSVDESLWAVAKLSFLDVMHGGRRANFNAEIYRTHSARIFGTHWARFNAVSSMASNFAAAGLQVEIAPKTEAKFHAVFGLAINYMRQYQLTPADAEHLALAEIHARTFVTADRQLATVFQRGYTGNLSILHLT